MTTFYSVIRYVPNPLAEESINIGIIATAGTETKTVFLNKWGRVSRFASEDISFLKEFKENIVSSPPTENDLRNEYCRWMNSIQFSDLRPSILSLDVLIDKMAKIYLHEEATMHQRAYGKEVVLRTAYKEFGKVMSERSVRNSRELLKKRYSLAGHLDKHTFDLAIVNGRPYMGAFVFSFGVHKGDIEKNVDAAAFAIEDVKKAQSKLPVALIADAPTSANQEDYERAKRIFYDLDAQILKPIEISKFANEVIDKLPKTLFEANIGREQM